MTATLALHLHEFAKGDTEPNVNVTCFLVLNGERKHAEHFVIPEAELPEAWVEDDLLKWLNANARAQVLGTAVRTPVADAGAIE